MGLRDWWAGVTGRAPAPEPALELPRPPTAPELLDRLSAIESDITAKAAEQRVSGVVAARVGAICRTARDIVPRLDQLGGHGTRDAHSVMATVTSYLPEALGGYLRLPRDYADNRPVAGGKTSLMLLVDQLDLLDRTMDQILDAATRRDVQALIAHGKFLEEKFGGAAAGAGTLDVGGGTS